MESATEQNKTADPTTWRRVVLEMLPVALLVWAAIVAWNVFAFGDTAAQFAVRDNLGHVGQILTHVPRNLVLVFGMLVVLTAAVGPGDALLRLLGHTEQDPVVRLGFGAAAGLGILIVLAYVLAVVHGLTPFVEWPLVLAGLAYSAITIRRWFAAAPVRPDAYRVPRVILVVVLALLAAQLYVCLLSAVTPDVGFDARYYHLAQAQRYAQHHGFYNLVAAERTWPYALPHYQETLYAFGWAMFGHVGAKLFAWGEGLITVLCLVAFARAWFGSAAVGVLASLIVFSTPILAWSTTTANNDVASAPLVLLALHGLLLWATSGSRLPIVGAGLFSGLSYGVKPFGALAVVALGVVALWFIIRGAPQRRKDLVLFGAAAFGAMLPAFLTAEWMVGDPLFPAASRVFPTEYGEGVMGALISTGKLGGYAHVDNILALPWVVTVNPLGFRDLVGPIWLAMAPLGLAVPFLARKDATVLRSMFGFAVAFAAMMALVGAFEFRYSAPILPVFALLIAYGALMLDWRNSPAMIGVIAVSLLCFTVLDNELLVPLQRGAANPRVMGNDYLNWRYVYGGAPDREIQLQYIALLEYTNAHLDPARDKIYDGIGLSLFNLYSEVPLFGGTLFGGPAALGEWTLSSPDAYARLKSEGCTYVAVPGNQLAALKRAPVWPHLKLVQEFPSINGPAQRDVLLRVE